MKAIGRRCVALAALGAALGAAHISMTTCFFSARPKQRGIAEQRSKEEVTKLAFDVGKRKRPLLICPGQLRCNSEEAQRQTLPPHGCGTYTSEAARCLLAFQRHSVEEAVARAEVHLRRTGEDCVIAACSLSGQLIRMHRSALNAVNASNASERFERLERFECFER